MSSPGISNITSSDPASTDLAYWNYNVPPSDHAIDCPPYLKNIDQKDLQTLSTPDSAYTLLTWSQIQHIVSTNDLSVFSRTPSQLRRYLEYTHRCCQQYGSVSNFISKNCLGWSLPLEPEGKGLYFESQNDWKITWNDWPYAVEKGIVHLLVWTKFAFIEEEGTEMLSKEAREAIEGFVERVFERKVRKGNVSLQHRFRQEVDVSNIRARYCGSEIGVV